MKDAVCHSLPSFSCQCVQSLYFLPMSSVVLRSDGPRGEVGNSST